MNVDLEVDTAWLFRDVDSAGEERGNPLDGGASGPEVDTEVLGEQLESSEQTLPAPVGTPVVSESGLRGRVQELELREQRLLWKVDQLTTWVAQEKNTSLWAQRQLEALQGELASQVREQERVAGRLRQQLRLREQALGRQAAALERSRWRQRLQLSLARQQACEQERELRTQVRQLERDVRRLCRAAGRLLAELDAPAGPRPQGPAAESAEEAAAHRRPEGRATERRLRAQLKELRGCVYELKLSEISLQGQVEDLTEQNQSLREELDTRAPEEKACEMAAAGHCGLTLGCVQDAFLPLPREEELDPSQGRSQQRPPGPDTAGGLRASAGQLAEGLCTWDCAEAASMPGPGTMGVLLRDRTRSDCEQLALALPPLDEQTLLPICGCAPRQCVDGSLLPAEQPQASGQSQAVTSAQETFLLVQMSSLPLCWSAGEPDTSPEIPQIQEVLDARPLLAPEATGHPDRAYHQAQSHGALNLESPRISNPHHPGKGSEGLKQPLAEPGGARGWDVEEQGARRPLGVPRGQCLWYQDAPGTQASSQSPQLEPPRSGGTSGPEGSPQSLSGRDEVRGQIWRIPGGLWSEWEEVSPATLTGSHGTKGPPPLRGQLQVERGRAGGRGGENQEGTHPWLGSTELHCERSPRREGWSWKDKRGVHQEGASPSPSGTPEEPGTDGYNGQDSLCWADECCWPGSSRPHWPAEGGNPAHCGPWAVDAGGSPYGRAIDTLEEEMPVCLQQLLALQLGSQGSRCQMARENGSFACKWPRCDDKARVLKVCTDCGVDACSDEAAAAEEVGEDSELGRTGGTPGVAPRLDGRSLSGGQLPGALEPVRRQCGQLVARLREERSTVLAGYAWLRGQQERSRRKVGALERKLGQRERRVSALEQDNDRLSGEVSLLRTEVDQYLQLVSDLEDCNAKSYYRISELEGEKEALQGELGRARRAVAQCAQRAHSMLERAARENAELWVLVSELGAGYQGLIQDILLGTEGVIQGLQGENARLLCRVRAFEQAATGVHPNTGPAAGSREKGQAGTMDKAVQATQLSGQRLARVGGLSWGEHLVQTGVQGEPSSGAESPRQGHDSPALPSAWGDTTMTQVLRDSSNGAGAGEGVHAEKRPWCSGRQEPELQGEDVTEEGLRLRIRHLHHQVLTLTCQLRDQRSLHRQLQAAQEETSHLREELRDQGGDFQKSRHEARLAASPLKAQVASLVHKCWEQDALVARLLQALRQCGAASPGLTERAQNVVEEEALAEYTAAFLTTSVREIPLPLRRKRDPRTSPAVGVEQPGFLKQRPQHVGGDPCPAHHNGGSPPPSELRSPARILALHKELRQSVCSNSWVNKSPLDFHV